MAGFDVKLFNVVMQGVIFMLIFTAFQTSGNVQNDVLNAIKDANGTRIFENKGYTSLAIIYSMFSVSNFLAPPIVSLIGPRLTQFIGGACYCVFIGCIIKPYVWSLYAASVVIGFGAALIWTAQGNFLTLNSNPDTMGRNSGIFWAIFQCSLLFGNGFVYFYFKGSADNIGDHERIVLYTVLLIACSIGTVSVVFLRKPGEPSDDSAVSTEAVIEMENRGPMESFKQSFRLLFTRDMMLLAVTMAYTGVELTFFSGVYGSSIGNIVKLEDRSRQIGLMGMMIGVGEILGGAVFGIFGKKTVRYGRDPIVLLGFITHMVTFYFIMLNVPDRAPLEETTGVSWFSYSLPAYALTAFMLGFGDACYNTQIYSILGTVYAADSAPAFALFKFVQSVTAAIGFAYTKVLVLKWQLLILVILAILGTFSFFVVERRHSTRENYESISPENSDDE